MPQIVKNTSINKTLFKDRIKEICNSLLPTSGYYAYDTTLPEHLKKSYLCSRSDLVSSVYSIIDNDTTLVDMNIDIIANNVFNLLKNVFLEMGRCRRVFWYDVNSPGTQNSPAQILSTLSLSPTQGTFTYFQPNFSFEYGPYKPTTQNNGNKNESGYDTYPATTLNWNNNTRQASNATRVNNLNINNLIEALNGVEAQLTNFRNTWSSKNNINDWWDGSATNSSASNKIFWVRYWCHSNCHSNCHGSRSRR